MLASKMRESYVLDWLKAETRIRSNQFGGVKGLGTDHALFLIWQTILENLDDYRAATVVTSLAYSKAFNRMSSLARKGASTGTIALIATFLTNRTMSIRVGSEYSTPKAVCGGCPQGSILDVFLFSATIDNIESGCVDLEDSEVTGEADGGAAADDDEESEDEAILENESVREAPAMSTPIRRPAALHASPGESPVTYLRKSRKPRRLEISGEGRLLIPHEINHRTEASGFTGWPSS